MSEPEDEIHVVGLVRTSQLSEPVLGARKIVADCGHECWISPSTVVALFSQKLRTSCLGCGQIDPDRKVELLPGGEDELDFDPRSLRTPLGKLILMEHLNHLREEARRQDSDES